ncbi:hypothetical protein B4U80_12691 [Leptotrombidium deliense]|uniref:Sushi domain-containing protein n=1 Tax=Leptotrombidium deliense TaxID=299467 RepID=A0A443SQL7_9ACAR|nr:hypothetical protein B4U80_12691 [Leptotrombidium deliense]
MCLNKFIQCPLLSPPKNGKYAKPCFNYAGAECLFLCNNGFKLIGNNTNVCTTNKGWTQSLPVCVSEKQTCEPLRVPDNAELVGTCTTEEGSKCRFKCKNGFEMSSGSPVLTCIKSKWSQTVPVCIQPTIATTETQMCSSLSKPVNGIISGNCSGHFQDSCTFICEAGFFLNGTKTITCQTNRQWSAEIPNCISSCHSLNPPTNGYLSGKCVHAKDGDVCEFSCSQGYKLNGHKLLKCVSQHWDSEIPICERVICPHFNTIANGRLIGNCALTVINSVCSVFCNTGYVLTGAQDLVCTANGWSSNLPECRPITCPPLSNPENALMHGKCEQSSLNDLCSFSCKKGYALVGNSTLMCMTDGKWDSTVPHCIAVGCSTLQPPTNGSMNGDCSGEIGNGKQCKFSCDKCFTLHGKEVLTCNTTNWDSSPPLCQRISCTQLSAPQNGYISGDCDKKYYCGSSCYFSCKSGYAINGVSKLDCNPNGQWSSKMPSCEPIGCQSLSPPTNGEMTGDCTDRVAAGKKCKFSCKHCYSLVGVSTVTCESSGKWNSPVPSCNVVNCSPLNAPENGDISGNCNPGICGSKCQVSCKPGFILKNAESSVLHCLPHAKWDLSVSQCLRSCPTIVHPANGYTSGVCVNAVEGNECIIRCKANFQLNGNDKIQCLRNGVWSAQPGNCTQGCTGIDAPYGGVWISQCQTRSIECPQTCVGYPGQKCTLVCSRGYHLIGSATTVCNPKTHQWNPAPPRCQVNSNESKRSLGSSKKTG